MSDEDFSVQDMLAAVSADIDQAQARIDDMRSKYSDDIVMQQQLDADEFVLDIQRDRVKVMKAIDKIIDPQ